MKNGFGLKDESAGRIPEAGVSVRKGITARAIILAIICLVIIARIIINGEMLMTGPVLNVALMPSIGGMMCLFLFLGVNGILTRFFPSFKLHTSEMVAIYIMVGFGSIMVSLGFVLTMVFSLASAQYYTLLRMPGRLAIGEWQKYVDSIPSFVLPKGREVIMDFWRGGAGEVPWGAWIAPIITWTVVFGVGVFVMICLAAIVRHYWLDRERLVFPLTLPVVAIAKDSQAGEGSQFEGLWRNKLLYIGFIWPILFTGLNGLRAYFPMLPGIRGHIDLSQMFSEEPFASGFAAHPFFRITYTPITIGIAYFLPSDLGFSIWFFHVLYRFLLVGMAAGGVLGYMELPLQRTQTLGAFVAMGVYALWATRGYLYRAFPKGRKLGTRDFVEEKEEPMSYAVAVWGAVLGIAFLVIFSRVFLSMSPLVSIPHFLVFFAATVGFARMRAESGIPTSNSNSEYLSDNLLKMFGVGRIGRRNLQAIGYFYLMEFGYYGSSTAWAVESLKLSDSAGLKRRSVVYALLIAFVAASLIGFVFALPPIYERGAETVASGLIIRARDQAFRDRGGLLEVTTNPYRLPFSILGFVVALFLTAMRSRFIWWPFHPVGYALSHVSVEFWSGIFIAWLIKSIVIRYGGAKVYQKSTAIFLGMILGDVIIQALLFVIGLVSVSL